MSGRVSRRVFLGGAIAAAASQGAAEPGKLPTRVLGRTKETPSVLALGCGSRLADYGSIERGMEAIQTALDCGITYLDTAQNYANGQSETWVGMMMPANRKRVFLASKTGARTGDECFRRFEESLKRLQTDVIDLFHIHGLGNDDNLAALESGGVIDALYKLRDQKAVRFIGVTSHTNPATMKTALERHDFDCAQMALNAALQGARSGTGGNMALNPSMPTAFEKEALPVAIKKNMGIIAMKVSGQDHLLGSGRGLATYEELLRYSLSLPVAVCTLGMPKLEMIRRNTEFARNFTPMPKEEMQQLSERMSSAYKVAVDHIFANHVDA
jgi:predicted aldo/keto reductase-like oxidoreductase